MKKLLHMCPNCSASWGVEEISFQECDECGWPNSNDDDEFDPDLIEDDEDSDIDEDDSFERCSECDGHDACEDFGCAIKAGIPIQTLL